MSTNYSPNVPHWKAVVTSVYKRHCRMSCNSVSEMRMRMRMMMMMMAARLMVHITDMGLINSRLITAAANNKLASPTVDINTCRWARRGHIGCCFFVCLCVCTVTDFSAQDKASGVKFCTVFHRRPGQGISHFGELCTHRSPKSDE